MIKVLLITHYDNMYGANRALLELVLRMSKSGRYEPVVVIPAEGEFTDRLKDEGIGYYISAITQWQAIYKESISFALKRNKRKKAIQNELDSLYEHFKDSPPDIIHSNSSVIGTGAMLAERFNCRHIWHVREFAREHYGMRYFYPDDVVESFYEKADCVVAISGAVKESVSSRCPKAKVVCVYDGIDTGNALYEQEKKDKTGDRSGVTEFLYTGYIFPAKRQMDLLKAADLLRQRGCYSFHITMAGNGDERYRKKLVSYMEKRGLSDCVSMPGFTKDVAALIRNSDVGVIASEYEGFGLVTVEYMLGGLPVLGRRSGATPEIVMDGETGLLFDNAEGLADAMEQMITDPDRGTEMGNKGRQRVRECFTVEKNADGVLKIYDEVIGQSGLD